MLYCMIFLIGGCNNKTEMLVSDEETEELSSEKTVEEGKDTKGADESNTVEEGNDGGAQDNLNRIDEFLKNYYEELGYTVLKTVYADEEYYMEYDGYKSDEIIVFKVTVEECEVCRYITLGSKDNWLEYSVLNEGY